MVAYFVPVDSTLHPAGNYHTISVHTRPADASNANVNWDGVVNAVGRQLTVPEQDWLSLLMAIHIADQVCEREEREEINRDITVAVRLHEPSRLAPHVSALQKIFGRMTHDSLHVILEPAEWPPDYQYPKGTVPKEIDAVALLSGGLDSACAAIETATASKSPCFVAFAPGSGHVIHAQREVVKHLTGPRGPLQHPPSVASFSLRLKHRNTGKVQPLPDQELTQRSRTLLFTGVAALIAAARGLDRVILGENGVMAINCPVQSGRFGANSTHTARPDVLSLMSGLYSSVFGCSITIQNPLLFRTKSEVVAAIRKANLEAMIPATHSCWIARQATHCGKCVPCVVRRFSTEAAGTTDVQYDQNVFDHLPPRESSDFNNIADYLLFVSELLMKSDEEVIFDYPELSVEGGEQDLFQIVELHRRWANDVIQVAQNHPPLRALLKRDDEIHDIPVAPSPSRAGGPRRRHPRSRGENR